MISTKNVCDGDVDAVEDCVLVAIVNGLGGRVGDTLGAIVGDIVDLICC